MSKQLSSMISRRRSSEEKELPSSPSNSSKKYKRKAFQKTATAKLPRPRFTLAAILSGRAHITRFDLVVFVILCMMFMVLYQATMDTGFFGKPAV